MSMKAHNFFRLDGIFLAFQQLTKYKGDKIYG